MVSGKGMDFFQHWVGRILRIAAGVGCLFLAGVLGGACAEAQDLNAGSKALPAEEDACEVRLRQETAQFVDDFVRVESACEAIGTSGSVVLKQACGRLLRVCMGLDASAHVDDASKFENSAEDCPPGAWRSDVRTARMCHDVFSRCGTEGAEAEGEGKSKMLPLPHGWGEWMRWLEGEDSGMPPRGMSEETALKLAEGFAAMLGLRMVAESVHRGEKPKPASSQAMRFSAMHFEATPQTHGRLAQSTNSPMSIRMANFLGIFVTAAERVCETDVIDGELEQLFEPVEAQLSLEDKISVLASVMPLIERHAIDSCDPVAARKWRETARSLLRYWSGGVRVWVCEMPLYDSDNEVILVARIAFDMASVLPGARFRPKLATRLPRLGENFSAAEFASSLRCEVMPGVPGASVRSVDAVERALRALFLALNSRDAESIDDASLDFVDRIEAWHEAQGSGMRPGQARQKRAWLCAAQTIQLIAIEQHRLIAATIIETSLRRVFPASTFLSRLRSYDGCVRDIDAEFRAEAEAQIQAHAHDFRWLAENFSDKKVKDIGKNFSKWASHKSSDVVIYRRLLASMAALSHGKRDLAVRFGEGITVKRTLSVNPQVFAYDLLLSAVGGSLPPSEALRAMVASFELRSSSHAYMTMVAMAPWLDSASRRRVVEVMAPSRFETAPRAGGRFAEIYADEIAARLDEPRKARFALWRVEQSSLYRSPFWSLRILQPVLQAAVKAQDWKTAAQAAQAMRNVPGLPSLYRQLFDLTQAVSASLDAGVDIAADGAWWVPDSAGLRTCLGLPSARIASHEEGRAFLRALPLCFDSIEPVHRLVFHGMAPFCTP